MFWHKIRMSGLDAQGIAWLGDALLGASSPINRMIGLQMPDCNSTDAVCGGGYNLSRFGRPLKPSPPHPAPFASKLTRFNALTPRAKPLLQPPICCKTLP